MKYNFLAAWAYQHRALNAVVDRILFQANALTLYLVKAPALVIVTSAQDSFIYQDPEPAKPTADREIWQQLRGAAITGISIKPDDRIISIHLLQKDIYGERKQIEMLCELMPPKPNVILLKQDSRLVLDALIKYSLADNPMRMVLVNQPYYPPQTSFEPDQSEGVTIPDSYQTQSLDIYFRLRHQQILLPSDAKSTIDGKIRFLKKELKRLHKKHKLQEQDLENALKMDYYQACAEAIKPNMHQIEPGQEELIVTNYFDPAMGDIKIPLQPDKSPQQNLHYYIKKYRKAKTGKSIIEINIKRTIDEMAAVQKLIQRLEAGEDIDLDMRDKGGSISQKVDQLDRILQLKIGDGWHIYIGRKAKENDFITTKVGKAQDWWFHSRIYRGAHVLLKNHRKQEPPAELVRACCALAAWYSQAKFSVNVPVDYTQIRYVRKPKGSAVGFVTYSNYKTFFANPKDIRVVREELGL